MTPSVNGPERLRAHGPKLAFRDVQAIADRLGLFGMLAGPQVDGAPARAIMTGTIKRVLDIQPYRAVEVALVAKTIERLADDSLHDLDPVPVARFPGMANLANVVHVEQIDQWLFDIVSGDYFADTPKYTDQDNINRDKDTPTMPSRNRGWRRGLIGHFNTSFDPRTFTNSSLEWLSETPDSAEIRPLCRIPIMSPPSRAPVKLDSVRAASLLADAEGTS